MATSKSAGMASKDKERADDSKLGLATTIVVLNILEEDAEFSRLDRLEEIFHLPASSLA